MQQTNKQILIDIRCLETGSRLRGYGYYVRNLITALLTVNAKANYSFLAYGKNNSLKAQIEARGHKLVYIKPPKIKPRFSWVWDQVFLPSYIKAISPDLFVSLDNTLPLSLTKNKKIKSVVVVHDLVPLIFEREYDIALDRKIDFKLKFLSAKRAYGVLTISNHSKKDIEKWLKIPSSRVKYIYESADGSFSRASDSMTDALRQKFAHGKKFIMTVGDYYGCDPRKEYLFLIDSFAKFKKDNPESNLILLLVGKSGGKNNEYSRIKERLNSLNLADQVVFTDYVTDEELAGLYSAAEAFVYPTKYEGFGLPILQAMGCGCPVLAANNSSIPEVAGEAAELFKTHDMDGFIVGLEKILESGSRYRKLGYENIKRFSWKKSAQEFANYLETI